MYQQINAGCTIYVRKGADVTAHFNTDLLQASISKEKFDSLLQFIARHVPCYPIQRRSKALRSSKI